MMKERLLDHRPRRRLLAGGLTVPRHVDDPPWRVRGLIKRAKPPKQLIRLELMFESRKYVKPVSGGHSRPQSGNRKWRARRGALFGGGKASFAPCLVKLNQRFLFPQTRGANGCRHSCLATSTCCRLSQGDAMYELSKSVQRRLHAANFLSRYFVGDGIDIGSGPDPLGQYAELFPLMGSVRAWDLPDGDAELMASCADNQYDFVHSSHCLEHMHNPDVALKNWFRIVKPGGHLVVLIPDEDMYEQGIFPSTYNTDHKATLTIFKTSSWSDKSLNVIELLKGLGQQADIIKLEQLTDSYRFALPRVDQTLTPIGECAIEFVVRKRPQAEVEAGGCVAAARLPRATRPIPLGAQQVFDNLEKVRDAGLESSLPDVPHSVVVPFATYSPWRGDAAFVSAHEAVRKHTQVDLYRCYDLWNLLHQVAKTPGDVLEVGVWRGGSGCLLGLAMKHAAIAAQLYLADTFTGVVKAGERDNEYKGGEHADTSFETVVALLDSNNITGYRILKGIFPNDTADQVAEGPIRFCHIDVDVYESAKDIFNWVWPRVPAGGIVVFDDYGFRQCEGVIRFVNEQRDRADAIFMHNLNGHAVLVKTR
jgi:SAM-dependent methyltransferase/predicted O-methyltransferase YrrM